MAQFQYTYSSFGKSHFRFNTCSTLKNMANSIAGCHYCDRRNSNLRRCGRCKSVYYCTKVCQTIDWPEHKAICVSTNKKTTLGKRNEDRRKTKHKIERKENHEEINNDTSTCEEGEQVRSIDKERSAGPKNLDCVKEETATKSLIFDKMKSEYDSENSKSEMARQTTEQEAMRHSQTGNSNIENDSKIDSDTRENRNKDSSEQSKTKTVNASGTEEHQCGFCTSSDRLMKCSRCKEMYYCSKECQRQDWKNHKSKCKKKLSEEEERILKNLKKKQDQAEWFQQCQEDTSSHLSTFFNFGAPSDRFFQTLTPEQALRRASRPAGSLARAVRLARIFFPLYDIVTEFTDIPSEPMFPFFPFMMPPMGGYVLVAFMYRYHEHVMRHGVYLKDAIDRESKVEFYLDFDNPFPFFSYSQVKPGGYICLVDPVMHLFMDGTVGIRINNPEEVKVLDIETVMK